MDVFVEGFALSGRNATVTAVPRAALRDVPSLRSALGCVVAAPFGANRITQTFRFVTQRSDS